MREKRERRKKNANMELSIFCGPTVFLINKFRAHFFNFRDGF